MIRLLKVALAAFATAAISMPAPADEAAVARLAGRTLSIVGTFSNTSTGARLWNVLSPHLSARLPQTRIRFRFNDAGGGISALNDVFAEDGKDLSIALSVLPELAFAQAQGAEGVAFDLSKAQWIIGFERSGHVMAVRRGLSLDMDELRQPGQRLLSPGDSINGSGEILLLMLNAVTGLHAQIVVGFNSADSLRAIVVGDLDIKRQQLNPEAAALLEAGEIVSLYVISDSDQLPSQVDRSRTLESVTLPGTPPAVLTYIRGMLDLGRAFLAAPNQDQEDVAALRVVLGEVMSDPAVVAQIAAEVAPIEMVPHETVEQTIRTMLLTDPKVRAAAELAHSCGLEMGRGTLERCDFSVLEQ
jgi:tripartite-type tricarboxylate transporter receptor subunit TctC